MVTEGRCYWCGAGLPCEPHQHWSTWCPHYRRPPVPTLPEPLLKAAQVETISNVARAVKHAEALRHLMGTTATVMSWDTAGEADAVLLCVRERMSREGLHLPPGWDVRTYQADDDLYLLGIYGPGEHPLTVL